MEFILSVYRYLRFPIPSITDKEKRIYTRVEFTRRKCKTAILLYYFRTAGVIHIFWALEYHFIEILKLILKENQIMKKAGFIIDQ